MISIIPRKPDKIKKQVFRFSFSEKTNDETKQVKKTFVNPIVLACASVK